MKDHTITAVALVISLATGLLGYFFQAGAWTTVEMIFVQNILLIAIQIHHYVKGDDPYLGPAAKEIRRFPAALAAARSIIESTVRASASHNKIVPKKSLEFLSEVSASMALLGHGQIDVDLKPGGAFFRELHAGDHAERSYFATSCVEPRTYWQGKEGAVLLARNKNLIMNGIQLKRYFIHPASRFDELKPVIAENTAIGVRAYLIDSSKIQDRLIRDFGICDDGEVAVELILDSQRHPQAARFYFRGSPESQERINELKKVWEELSMFAQPAT